MATRPISKKDWAKANICWAQLNSRERVHQFRLSDRHQFFMVNVEQLLAHLFVFLWTLLLGISGLPRLWQVGDEMSLFSRGILMFSSRDLAIPLAGDPCAGDP
jgi:hypothetical protein